MSRNVQLVIGPGHQALQAKARQPRGKRFGYTPG
jgi:hypothetical protein